MSLHSHRNEEEEACLITQRMQTQQPEDKNDNFPNKQADIMTGLETKAPTIDSKPQEPQMSFAFQKNLDPNKQYGASQESIKVQSLGKGSASVQRLSAQGVAVSQQQDWSKGLSPNISPQIRKSHEKMMKMSMQFIDRIFQRQIQNRQRLQAEQKRTQQRRQDFEQKLKEIREGVQQRQAERATGFFETVKSWFTSKKGRPGRSD